MDIPAILIAATRAEWRIVELDHYATDMAKAVAKSVRYLKTIAQKRRTIQGGSVACGTGPPPAQTTVRQRRRAMDAAWRAASRNVPPAG
jgi:hypothetical protein